MLFVPPGCLAVPASLASPTLTCAFTSPGESSKQLLLSLCLFRKQKLPWGVTRWKDGKLLNQAPLYNPGLHPAVRYTTQPCTLP